MAEQMMRKQMLFAHQKVHGSAKEYCWWNAADEIHMMSSYAKLQERKVNAKVGFVMSQHPETASIPVSTLIDTLKKGANDQGLIDSKLPGLSQVMAQMPNSREHWFAERQGIEAMSRDLGEANWFVTFNNDVRHWEDCRILVHELECLNNREFKKQIEEWYPSTEEWTALVDKYAVLLSDYLQRRFEKFFKAFFCDICGVPKEQKGDYTQVCNWC